MHILDIHVLPGTEGGAYVVNDPRFSYYLSNTLSEAGNVQGLVTGELDCPRLALVGVPKEHTLNVDTVNEVMPHTEVPGTTIAALSDFVEMLASPPH